MGTYTNMCGKHTHQFQFKITTKREENGMNVQQP